MKKFKYNLEPILKIRKFQEKIELSHYAKVLGEINKNHEMIHDANESQTQLAVEERNKMLSGIFRIEDKILGQEYLAKLATIKQNALGKIDGLKEESNNLRKKAEKARQNRRVLEILKEKKHTLYQTEFIKNEYKELDEFNSRGKRK